MAKLLHWYKLDGNANDSIGSAHGTNNGVTWVNGKIGQCASFDGSSYIQVPNFENSFSDNYNSLSFTFWAKSPERDIKRSLLDTSYDGPNNDDNGWQLFTYNTDELRLSLGDGTTHKEFYSTMDLTENWNHYTFIISKDLIVKCYLNGVLQKTEDVSSYISEVSLDVDTSDLFIGMRGDGWANFIGSLDDIRFYSGELSTKEIQDLSKGLVAYYNFNSDNASDSSGQGNDGTVYGATWVDDKNGYYNFDGTDDYIETQSIPFGDKTEITIYAKLYKKSSWSSRDDFIKSGSIWFNFQNNGKLQTYLKGISPSSGYYEGNTVCPVEEWFDIAFTYNANIGQLKQYLNGELDKVHTGLSGEWSDNNLTFKLAKHNDNYTDVKVSKIKIFSTQLSDDEIKQELQTTASLDKEGNLHSQIQEPNSIPIVRNYPIEEKTNGTYRNIGTDFITNGNGEIDVSAFVESDDTLGNFAVYGEVYTSDVSIYPTTFEYKQVNNDKGVNGTFSPLNGSWKVGWNTVYFEPRSWDNVANTDWSNMNRLEIYRSGSSGDTADFGIRDLRLIKYPDNSTIGKGFQVTNSFSKGTDFNELGFTQQPAAYYPFNGNAKDYSGNGNDGSVNGATLTTDRFGNNNSAYEFDGTDDYILFGNDESLEINNSFTISVWCLHDIDPNENTNNNWRGICSKTGSYRLLLEQDGSFSGSAYISGSRKKTDAPSSYFEVGVWKHVIYTYNGDNGLARIYVDGEIAVEQTKTTGTIDTNTNQFNVAEESGSGRWNGKIDDVLIIPSSLTPQQAKILYDTQSRNQKMKLTTHNAFISNQLIEVM